MRRNQRVGTCRYSPPNRRDNLAAGCNPICWAIECPSNALIGTYTFRPPNDFTKAIAALSPIASRILSMRATFCRLRIFRPPFHTFESLDQFVGIFGVHPFEPL